jgi:hypothetical protein
LHCQCADRCLESTFWFGPKTQIFEAHRDEASGQSWPRHEAGYIGAYDFAGFNQPLLMQVAEEIRAVLPGVVGTHELKQVWAYKYDSSLEGVQVHADAAAINVNLWLTPSEANLDPVRKFVFSQGIVPWKMIFCQDRLWTYMRKVEERVAFPQETGGLIVYKDIRGDDLLNGQGGRREQYMLDELVARHAANRWVVPYARNRCVIFDSSLVHRTDRFRFADGYENRRINLTFLFGKAPSSAFQVGSGGGWMNL